MNTPNDKSIPANWFWDSYWRANRVAACLTDYAGNYHANIRHSWEDFFKIFPDNSKLLDIGTGNGAIASIANEIAAATGRRFVIHGVDLADIDPARFVNDAPESFTAIHFHSRTPAENLPFIEHYFDGITGQYALEYTDMQLTVQELKRVAKSGAQLRFMLHAQNATPVKTAERELQEIKFLVKILDLTGKARDTIRAAFAFENAEFHDTQLEARAKTARENYMAAASKADAHYENLVDKKLYAETLVNIQYIWDHRHEMSLERILKAIDSIETDIHAHASRLENMCQVALSTADAKKVCDLFIDTGFQKVRLDKFHAQPDQRFLGWELKAVVR